MTETDFSRPLTPPWRITEIGRGNVEQSAGALRLAVVPTPAKTYSDAQISDYTGKRDFRWLPPVRLTVTAYAVDGEHSVLSPQSWLHGTAGFGFWNHPFVPGERGFRLPQAVWFFFSSPPSNMQLAQGVPGSGWKAATIDATRWPFFVLLPTAPIALLLMRMPVLYQHLWPIGQRAIGVSEHLLDINLLAHPHTYILDWRANQVAFALDGNIFFQTSCSPRGPLGFIAWIDNQYATVTPQGGFGFGLLPVEHEQAVMIEHIHIESL